MTKRDMIMAAVGAPWVVLHLLKVLSLFYSNSSRSIKQARAKVLPPAKGPVKQPGKKPIKGTK